MAPENKKTAIVIGGGISGLTAAYRLQEAGNQVTLLESNPKRTGGKIESEAGVDHGAEFVDSTQKPLIELCQKLGVNLIKSDFGDEVFVLPSGKKMTGEEFWPRIKPIQELVAKDKEAIALDPEGKRAQHLDGISLSQYFKELSLQTAEANPASLMDRLKNGFDRLTRVFRKSGRVNNDLIETLANTYTSESGRGPDQVSALQYVNEASPQPGALLASDCAYRIEGGTETLIRAMERDLRGKGVEFKMGANVTDVHKQQDGSFAVSYTTPDGSVANLTADKATMALPMYALSKVRGMESFFDKQDLQTIQNGQYTHNAKFTIKTKGTDSNDCLFTSEGMQCWRSEPGRMTFLVGGEKLNQLKGKNLIEHCLADYAKAAGKSVDELFDKSQVSFRGPNTQKPCYASSAPGQTLKLQRLSQNLDALAAQGLGVVGTYLPSREPGNASIGFMDCGVDSANRTVEIMTGRDRALARAQQQAIEAGLPTQNVSFNTGKSEQENKSFVTTQANRAASGSARTF